MSPDSLNGGYCLGPQGIGSFTRCRTSSELDSVVVCVLVSLSFFPEFANFNSWIVLIMCTTCLSFQTLAKISMFLWRSNCPFIICSTFISRYYGIPILVFMVPQALDFHRNKFSSEKSDDLDPYYFAELIVLSHPTFSPLSCMCVCVCARACVRVCAAYISWFSFT
jgi:hypothetical protein